METVEALAGPDDKKSHEQIGSVIRSLTLLRLAPLAALLLAFALRLYRLGVDSLWYDETFSVYLSGLDLVSLTRHAAGDIHPPLYYYVLHFWLEIAGKSEFALAFLSLLFGVLLVAATFRLASKLFDRSVAAVSALLVATSPFNLWYGQEVRMYTLAALLTVVSLLFALEATEDDNPGRRRFWPWVGYAIFSALGLYVLYYVAFALISLNLFVAGCWLLGRLWRFGKSYPENSMGGPHPDPLRAQRAPGRERELAISRPGVFIIRGAPAGAWMISLKWVAAQVGVVILYLPWLPTALRQVLSPAVPPWRHFLDLGQVLAESWSVLSLGHSSDPAQAWPFLLLFAGFYALGLVAALRLWGRSRALLLAGAVWGPVLLIFAVSLATPLFHSRYVFIYSPLFYVTLSLGLVCVFRFASTLGLLNLLVALGVFATSAQAYFHSDAYAPDDFRSAVRYVEERWGPGDIVLLDAGYVYPAFLYYYRGEPGWRGRLDDYPNVAQPAMDRPVVVQMGSIGGDARLGRGDPEADFYPTTKDEVARDLAVVAERHQRLWLLRAYDTVTDPKGFVRGWLAENGVLADEIMVQGQSNIRVQRYLLGAGRGVKPSAPLAANFDNAVGIVSFEASPSPVKGGETAYLRFRWLRQGRFDKDVRAYVALVDERGRVWQQQDNAPVGRLHPSSKWPVGAALPDVWPYKIPPGTPPGSYKLVGGVYLAASGQPLEVRAADGKPVGPQAVLGSLAIEANPSVVLPPGLSGVKADFGGGLGLADYKLGTRRIKPGESLRVDLFWKALAAAGIDHAPVISLRDRGGKTVGRQEGPPVVGSYPTSRWQKGELVWDQRDLVVDAAVPDGDYTLYLSVNGKDLVLGTVGVRGRSRSYEVPKEITNRLSVRLGDSVELLGFDVEPFQRKDGPQGTLAEVGAGQKVRLVLYWRALKRMETSYTVFTQLLDGANRIQGQRDRPPGDGALPTSGLLQGEVIVDAYEVQLKPEAGAGELLLILGMYDAKSGQRLAVADATGQPLGDAVVLGKVTVRAK